MIFEIYEETEEPSGVGAGVGAGGDGEGSGRGEVGDEEMYEAMAMEIVDEMDG